jgi:cyclopropane-fatty-acyl-phospholipid synthase
MTDRMLSRERLVVPGTQPGLADRIARRALTTRLANLARGQVVLDEPAARMTFGRVGPDFPVRAVVRVHDAALYRKLALRGHIGAAEAFIAGAWSTDDLTALIRILVRNRDVLDGFETGPARFVQPVLRAWHALRRNTRSGSQRNIAAHYDLGNDFFALFLDPTMTYSGAVFERGDASLEEAQRAKYERVCGKLELGPHDHVLEIGTGWGGFALHAASRHGCRVTTTTLSREQATLARRRIHEAGLQDRITVLTQDYRELTGVYPKLASIEMVEAVGSEHLDAFCRVLSDRLAPDGMACLQAITIADQAYERALRSVDFIQRYVFPGGFLPSVAALTAALARASDLRLFQLEDLTPHYERTMREWRERFGASREAIRGLGYGEEFLRLWEFYLCYCEGAFAERAIGSVQLLLTKPLCRRAPVLAAFDPAV